MGVIWERNGIKIKVNAPPRENHPLPHVHATFRGKECSIAIADGMILANSGFTKRELRALVDVVIENQADFMAEWEMLHGKE